MKNKDLKSIYLENIPRAFPPLKNQLHNVHGNL